MDISIYHSEFIVADGCMELFRGWLPYGATFEESRALGVDVQLSRVPLQPLHHRMIVHKRSVFEGSFVQGTVRSKPARHGLFLD